VSPVKSPSPESTRSYTLRVEGQPADELFIVDSSFELVARGVALLEKSLPAGVYKVKSRRAREEFEKIILLDQDQTIRPQPTAFASPAPFGTSTLTHEYHRDAAESESRNVHVVAGIGARIFLQSRYWTAPQPTAEPQGNPARGLSLRRLSGQTIVEYERASVIALNWNNDGRDPAASCTVSVDPGTYLLRQEGPNGSPVERSVVASPDWQTQVFVLKNEPRSPSAPTAGPEVSDAALALLPDSVSVFMSRDGFDPWRNDMELAEVARIALTDERRIMSDQLMAMLDGKFENPMLGIFGAHLLLLSLDRAAGETTAAAAEAPPAGAAATPRLELTLQAKDLDVIVQNLRRLVGDRHPDVEALSLRASDPSLRHRTPLTEPPMLRRSWSLFVAASNDAPSLCPPELWTRVRHMTPSPPYLTWLPGASGTDPAHDLVKRMARRTPAAVKRARRPVGAAAAAAPSRQVPRAGGPGGPARGRAARDLASPLEAIAPDPVPTAPKPRAAGRRRVHPDVRRQLSLENDIPRAVVDRAFRGS
jgi:hypothetical protein